MQGSVPLIEAIVRENGLAGALIQQNKAAQTLPGFFRPTKRWDYVITHRGRLIALLELKSQVGSFGNNCNNRTEEAIGSAVDFWTAFREGAFGESPHPFLGYLMLVEDCDDSRRTVSNESTLYPVFPEFKGCSYLKRYQLLCQKLVAENLYTCGSLISSPTSSMEGTYGELCERTSMRRFASGLAAAIAAAAAEHSDQ
jgi:hypothetical protein